MDAVLKFGIIFALILLNAFFVASEFALVAVRKTRIAELAKKGNKSAKLVQNALEDINNFISACQLGVTFVSLMLGWLGEPTIARVLEPFFHFLPTEAALFSSHAIAIIIAFSLITFLDIVLGELVPKTIALQKPEKTSIFIIAPLTLFANVFKPFVLLFNKTGLLVLSLLGIKVSIDNQSVHSEEEIKMILAQSAEGGEIEKEEAEMVYSVFKMGDIPVKQIMLPRTEIIAFEKNAYLQDVIKVSQKNPHSRFPVYEGSIDNIIGFVHIKDVYRALFAQRKIESVKNFYKNFLRNKGGKKISQTNLVREILQVGESRRIDDVLIDMRKKRIHIAEVNDEFGGTSGIVTLEDIVESLVGEIQDEFEDKSDDIEKIGNGEFLVDGLTSVEKVDKKFELGIKGQGYSTISGLFFGLLGRSPKKGDKLKIGGVTLEAQKMHGKRIEKILLLTKNLKK